MSVLAVVHCKREPFDVYVGRPSKWGNPFIFTPEVSRYDLLQHYKIWLYGNRELLLDLHELDGKVLGCWCAPELCHGHVLAEAVDLLCLERSTSRWTPYDLSRSLEMYDMGIDPLWEPWTHCEEFPFVDG